MNNQIFTVLAIDDDITQLELLRVFSASMDFPKVEFLSAETGGGGLALVTSRTIDLVLTDYRLPDMTGIEVLQEVKRRNPLISVVVMTAYESAGDAVAILKQGGDDYLVKPTKHPDIEHLILRLFEQRSVERENIRINQEIKQSFENLPLVYKNESMKSVLNLAARSAESDATVLITGESGTGKELIARLIHQTSFRRDKPFVTVNIAALPESLMESELYGHMKGSFTGADRDRMGRFEEADGGTLFIDEIGDIPLPVQVKLLRSLQFGQVQRIGENQTRTPDVRIVAATNRDIEAMIAEKIFRADLYWRINVIQLSLPPLRRRKDEIPVLADYFIKKYNTRNKRAIEGISREALDLMMAYDFPGNIRELENIIERAVILTRGNTIHSGDLQLARAGGEEKSGSCDDLTDEGYDIQLKRLEERLIEEALEESSGNQSEAARKLQISERRLRSRMEILNLHNSRE